MSHRATDPPESHPGGMRITLRDVYDVAVRAEGKVNDLGAQLSAQVETITWLREKRASATEADRTLVSQIADHEKRLRSAERVVIPLSVFASLAGPLVAIAVASGWIG